MLKKLITNPNLPAEPVTLVLMGRNIMAQSTLKALGIEIINVKPCERLHSSVSEHADMLALHIGDNIFIEKSQSELESKLNSFGIKTKILNSPVSELYPNDCSLNAAIIGNTIFYNPKAISKEIIDYSKEIGLKCISVNQGYCKCSICVINENAIITDDPSIHNAAVYNGFHSLLISKGSIKLKDRNYGFIGGCTGLIDKNKLTVCGNIKTHTDAKEILKFLDKYNIEPISLFEGVLTDIGGILPII